MRSRLRAALLLAATLPCWPCHADTPSVRGAAGIEASLDAASGRYEVRSAELGLAFAGTLGTSASDVTRAQGSDRLGAYDELSFRWHAPVALAGSIRTYAERPVVVFTVTAAEALSAGSLLQFPSFTRLPQGLHAFGYQDMAFAAPVFAAQENGTPWLLFDERLHAAVLSPASHFMIARLKGNATSEITSTVNAGVTNLPSGFAQQTLLAFATGINSAWECWGSALLQLQGVARPSNDADTGLRYLGYWTDNGASYYYNYDHRLGYAGTLQALVARYRAEHIPLRYLQLDSWWYYKTLIDPEGHEGQPKNPQLPLEEWNRYGGLLEYTAHPGVFAQGLAAFQQRIGLPLILHNRWIDPASPYHRHYRITGVAAVDPKWWGAIMDYASAAHAVTYEQDWLNVIYDRSPELADIPGMGESFTGGMAQAAAERGLSVQYSMSLPRHFLEGSRYANVTTTRVTPDRFGWRRWDAFLYTSRLASALGLWPWTDVFMSAETDNLLLATLSAGMVGIGDAIGDERRDNLLHAVRADGVIVKPDTPIVPLDAMYAADASRALQPMIAVAHTDHGPLRTAYVFSYRRSWRHLRAAFTPREVGISGAAYVYDVRAQHAQRLKPSDAFVFHLAPRSTAYFIVAPVSHSGIALVGDADHFVTAGRKRIPSLTDEPQRLVAEVRFAAGEDSVRLSGYAPYRPAVSVQEGSAGPLRYEPASGHFEVSVSPGAKVAPEEPGGDPVRRAMIAFQRSD
jgi:hypothetical protein